MAKFLAIYKCSCCGKSVPGDIFDLEVETAGQATQMFIDSKYNGRFVHDAAIRAMPPVIVHQCDMYEPRLDAGVAMFVGFRKRQ